MNHLDLFSGIGGFSLGLKQAGIEPDWIGFSDIDKYANKLFQRRFPNARRLGSITDVRPNDLPNIDLITFGFPCQDLSIAGKRGGLSANRSSLFFKAIELVAAKRPKYFIFENVKGLFSSNGGKDFDIVLRSIADIGYDGQWQLLNTRWFLPQNRERVYFVGHIRGECRPKIFPIGESDQKIRGISKQRIQKQRLHTNTITARYEGEGADSYIIESKQKGELNQIGVIGKDSEATRVYDTTCARTIKNGGGMGAKTGLYKTNSSIRRLTPTECERLQGFPDGWTEGQSDTQRYKQLGNTVSVPVVQSIMEKLNDR